MLLLTFLLIPNIFAAPTDTVDDYSISIDNNILTNIVPYQSNRDLNKNLNLSSQNISSIGNHAFYNVPDIETLDLSKNNISTLDTGVFSRLRKLKHLSLANNPLKNFRRAFEGLEHLQSLDISRTSVRELGPSYFFGIPKSTDIITSGDELETISRALFTKAYVNESAHAVLCQHKGIVSSLSRWVNSKPLGAGCTRVQIDLVNPHWWVRLNQSGISGFERDWYRLYDTKVDGLDLRGNNIVNMTSELFNSLPYRLKYIDLSENKIERVTKRSIVLKNLLWLYLSNNLINEIENDAFTITSLERLRLDGNRLNDLRFVATLPRNLVRLNLRNNQLSEQQLANSFSTLHELTNLDLAQNQITELTWRHFVGLKTLLHLDLHGNGLKKMDADCFSRTSRLKWLNLSNNNLTNLEYDVFYITRKLKILDLSHNYLKTLPRYMFSRLTSLKRLYLRNNALKNIDHAFAGLSSLEYLDISHNPIVSVKKEDFTEVPSTVTILSKGNTISCAVLKDQLSGQSLPDSISLCISNGIVNAVRQMTEMDSPLPEECQRIKLAENFEGSGETALNLKGWKISGFAENWYKLHVYVSTVVLDNNIIVDVTSEMLNGLPENVKYVYVRDNMIKYLKKGVIVNKYLRILCLHGNEISEIEQDALINTDLVQVDVSFNRLQGVQFVIGMPSSVKQLDASGNELGEIPAGTFSRLNKLKFLRLESASVNNIGPESFRGLSSLKVLSLANNKLTTIDEGAFQDTKALEELTLRNNQLESLDKRIFHNLTHLTHIDLQFNELQKITNNTFPDLPDSLQTLNLQNNQMTMLEAGSFVGGLKYELMLQNNKLKIIDEGAFNLPNLVVLDLANNELDQLNGDVFKDLPNLNELYLDGNNIMKIHKGAARYLNKLYILDLSENPITTLQSGAFSGLSNLPDQKFEALMQVYGMPIEHINGDLFSDESKVS